MIDILDLDKIKSKCRYPIDIILFDEIDSTNRYAKSIKKDNALVITNAQSKGRGRLGRDFISSKGKGIYMSILLKYDKKMMNPALLTCYTGTIVTKVLERLWGLNPGIKWVNDIYIENKKVCGILVESVIKNNTFDKIIIGIGINVYKQEFPIELVNKVTSLEDKVEVNVSRNDIISAILNEFFDSFNQPFMDYYRKHLILKDKVVEILEQNRTYYAKVLDVNDNGELVVDDNGLIKTLYTGEVTRIKMENKQV